MLIAIDDPSHPEHEFALEMKHQIYGEEGVDPAKFDPRDVDDFLQWLDGRGVAGAPGDAVPGPLSDMLRYVAGPAARPLHALVQQARLAEAPLVDADVATVMVSPLSWLLDLVGDEGIKLTGAGYVPPAQVKAVMEVLGPQRRTSTARCSPAWGGRPPTEAR